MTRKYIAQYVIVCSVIAVIIAVYLLACRSVSANSSVLWATMGAWTLFSASMFLWHASHFPDANKGLSLSSHIIMCTGILMLVLFIVMFIAILHLGFLQGQRSGWFLFWNFSLIGFLLCPFTIWKARR